MSTSEPVKSQPPTVLYDARAHILLRVLVGVAGEAHFVASESGKAGLFLIWKIWFAPTGAGNHQPSIGPKPWQIFVAGMLVTLGNPKIMVF
jgi:hypothetical protein